MQYHQIFPFPQTAIDISTKSYYTGLRNEDFLHFFHINQKILIRGDRFESQNAQSVADSFGMPRLPCAGHAAALLVDGHHERRRAALLRPNRDHRT